MKLSEEDYERAKSMYRFENKYEKDIAEEFCLNTNTLHYYFRRDKVVRAYRDTSWLYDKIVTEAKTTAEVAEMANCNQKTIYDNLKKMGISQELSRTRTRKVLYTSDFFKTIDTEHKAYWLGFSMIDGGLSFSKSSYRLTFQLQRRDRNHLEKFREGIAHGAKIIDGQSERTPGNVSEYSILKIYSKRICEDLVSLGMVPSKKTQNEFPNIPDFLLPHFIRGVFDADGSFYLQKDKGDGRARTMNFVIASSSFKIVNEIVLILQKEFNTTISSHEDRNMMFLNVGGNIKTKMVMDWIYKDATICLERKKESYDNALAVISLQKR